MRSPTAALLWEIWRRNHLALAVIVMATAAGLLLDYAEQPTDDPSSLITLLAMVSFVSLFGIFSYTEPAGTGAIGSFPRRLFTLPVSTARLVTLPVLAGIVSVELLYLLWLAPLSRGGSLSTPFVCVLLAALMVFFQAVFWVLERLGPLRLMAAGGAAMAVYGLSLLPTWPPGPPPAWRSEAAVGSVVSVLAIAVFLLTIRHIGQLRCGGDRRKAYRIEPLMTSATGVWPRDRRAFASPSAAQFWFEWRSSGLVLPVLVGAVLIGVVAPLSWIARGDAGGTFRLLLGTLATPVIFAIPVGMAFARPTFWSEDLSLPAFVAIRPLTGEQLVAIKMKAAAATVAISWAVIVCFIAAWLSVWANVDVLDRLALRWSTAVLILLAGGVLTWRSLVSRLWTGLSGSRPLFVASVTSLLLIVIAGLVFAADRLPEWVLSDPARMRAVLWMLSGVVAAKCALAIYSWRRVSAVHVRRYLAFWSAATACLIALVLALDAGRVQSLLILSSLLAVPLARIGLAPASLSRNRHR